MIITFAGDLGSGKSTVCKLLLKEGFKRISVGDTWREMASKKNFSIHEMNDYVLKNPHLDIEMDEITAIKARSLNHCVVEGRVQWHFLPESLKVYLKVDTDVAAKRIFNDKRASEKENTSIKTTKEKLLSRTAQDIARFKDIYKVNYQDMNNYDIVIDTTHKSPEEVVAEILIHTQK